MKIAVCLSGQPRTIKYTTENIKLYFSEHDTDFFCHAWDYNTYKRKNLSQGSNNLIDGIYWEEDSPADIQEVIYALNTLLPKKTVIEGLKSLPHTMEWSSMFYSLMMANHYKKIYEKENNFRYDLVFRARYDTIFNPAGKLQVPMGIYDKDNYLDVYGLFRNRMASEYSRMNLSDYCFYGSSTAMDILCDTYKYAYRNIRRKDDWCPLGPGTMLSEICDTYNIDFIGKVFSCSIYRKEMIPKDSIEDYREISEFSNSFYA